MASNWSFYKLDLHSHALRLNFFRLWLHLQTEKYINLHPWMVVCRMQTSMRQGPPSAVCAAGQTIHVWSAV